jgi:uroporphyrinogen decarboxylase
MAALNFKQPDRVPLDFNAHRSSGISVIAYRNLRKYLGLPPSPLYIYDIAQQLAIVEEDVLDFFDIDTFQLGCEWYKYPEFWKDWELQDGAPCKLLSSIDTRHTPEGDVICNSKGKVIGKQPRGCYYFEQTLYPLEDDLERDDFSDYDDLVGDAIWIGLPRTPGQFDYKTPETAKRLRERAAACRDSSDRAIYAIFGGNLMETGNYIFRMDNHLCELAANPEGMRKFQDTVLERHMKDLAVFLDTVGDYIDIIGFSDDLGSQNGPLMSREMYMDFFFPGHKKMWSYIHERFSDLKIGLHCCGSVRPLMPLLVEAGLDAINPIQFTCNDMDLSQLKKEFYGSLALWGGGCDTRSVLPGGKPAEIASHVRENLKLLNQGGGFVFQQVHNIQADVPPENIVEMFKTVRDFA